ncbi:uncharacterized protein LOC109724721 [Ananas comosus]|uniref:tRNA pseudouridine synthase n=1 Tax=Ananas comosus TaxID=4615 RepID=A0A6P5GKP0_ANACO|nr:uncharacterized protein LOC109724721 [Ananas comosus]XP_020109230.1 uncharacterized protein LOC109724721 [Ananas comosus]XP_020109231.1 uncharacterized protein LOC109724721 [Ananas comosus]XP_020109232.1 uncharacterized protein LOC109724721 [Ananas comosus]
MIATLSAAAAAAALRGVASAAAERMAARGVAMESAKPYVHYNHTDASHRSRWTARESYQYMYARPWDKVVGFYSRMVRGGKGASSLSILFPNENLESLESTENNQGCDEKASVISNGKGGRWERVTFKIVVSYHGGSFDGWQKQPGLNTVQGLVEKSLGKFVDERKAKQLKEKSLPVEGCAVVAGRTDKGVTALQQVCSFYTWRKDVESRDIMDAVNEAAPEKLRALLVSKVSREFHPNFVAKWRRYFYIFPLDEEEPQIDSIGREFSKIADCSINDKLDGRHRLEQEEQSITSLNGNGDDSEDNTSTKPKSFCVSKVNRLIQQLEGKSLSYKMFARDTQASRSTGPPTECFMFHSRAAETKLPCVNEDDGGGMRVMCVELVGNRFLRKMVRVLVATAIREAAAGADDDALLNLMDATCRRATAPPAPPEGLCLVDVGYGEFKQENCLIIN